MVQGIDEQSTREPVIRLGYTASCGTSIIKIFQIKLARIDKRSNEMNLGINLMTSTDASFSVSVGEVNIEGVPFRVAKVVVSIAKGSVVPSSPLNLGIVENAATTTPFVYFEVSGLECKEGLNAGRLSVEVRIDRIAIYALDHVRVTRYRVLQEHEDPFSAKFTAEYTLVNNLPFPVRFLYLNLQRFIKGMEVRDEEDNVLRFLTMHELRETFGEDIIERLNEFYVVVDLGSRLEPGRAKVIRLVGTEEISETRDYVLNFGLSVNVTEGVVIRPPHGYEVVIDGEDIVAVRDASRMTRTVFNDRNQVRPIFVGSAERKSVKLDPKFRLDRFVNPVPVRGSNKIRSPAVVDLEFRLYEDKESTSEEPLFRDPVENPGIAIRYSLEVQHKGFWDSLLTFFSVLVFGLFFQEFFYDLALTLHRLYRPILPFLPYDSALSFALTLALGSVTGYLYAARSGLVRGLRQLLESSLMMLVYSLSVAIIAVDAITSFGPTVHAIISELGGFYAELEFATLVAVELTYFLAERAVRDEYRRALMTLTVLTLVSMLLLVPWIA